MTPVLRTALHLHAALYQVFDTSPAEIIRHFIVSNSHFNTSVPTATLIRSLKWRPQISPCVWLCSRFYEGPCHCFWGRIVLIPFPIWPKARYSLSQGLRTMLCNTFYPFGSHVVLVPFPIWPLTGLRLTQTSSLEQETLVVLTLLLLWWIEHLRLYDKAHNCQTQIYKVCKTTVLISLWTNSVDIFARPIMPLSLELYVLKCQVFRYFI